MENGEILQRLAASRTSAFGKFAFCNATGRTGLPESFSGCNFSDMSFPPENSSRAAAPAAVVANDLPVASIIVMTHNHGPYIRRAIEGVLEQKASFPFELIIGEDCSTDNTREIVFEYQRAHPEMIRVITSGQNVGVLENARRTEQVCRGRHVCLCDGDDYWHSPQKLERDVTFLETHPDYSMVHSAFRMYYVATGKLVPEPLRITEPLNDADAFNEILSGRRHVWPLTACMRGSILKSVLQECPECYDARFLMQDTQRWLEMARRGKVKYFPESSATRQVLFESVSQSRNPDRALRFALSNKDVYDHYIDKYGCSPEAKKGAKTRCAFYVLSCAYEAGNVPIAKAALEEYRKVGASPPLEGRFYYYGSRGPVLRKLARPVIAAIDLWRKVSRRLRRILGAASR